jgi:MoaA/NifB/PqqE/SkfB family radical SAM enzyme
MYSPIRHVFSIFNKANPVHLTFFVTNRCNAKCPYCFYLQSKDFYNNQQEYSDDNNSTKKELTLTEIEKVSSSFGNLLWLAFSGGEIFLRRDLAELSYIFYKNNKPAYMLFPTNGLTPSLIVETMKIILEKCRNSVTGQTRPLFSFE